jgi:hypothetical protein
VPSPKEKRARINSDFDHFNISHENFILSPKSSDVTLTVSIRSFILDLLILLNSVLRKFIAQMVKGGKMLQWINYRVRVTLTDGR